MKPLPLALLLAALLLPASFSYSQSGSDVVTVQPTIMVIPFTKEGEDIRTILDNDPDLSIAITTVQAAFDQRDFTTIDFGGSLKAVERRGGMTLESQTSLKQAIIEYAGSDIYVESRLSLNRSGNGTTVAVQLNAIDSYTGAALSNEVCRSQRFRTDDIGRLAERALNNCLDNFLDTMNGKFGQIVKDGRSLVIDIQFAQESTLTMDTDVGPYDDALSDVLEDWFADHAYKNYYRIAGTGDTYMLIDPLRIPLREPGTDRNYTPSKFSREIRRYIRSDLNIDCKMDVLGATIFVTLENWR